MAQSGKLKLYGDLISQPSRAVLLFCRLNNIAVEFHLVNLAKGENRRPEFKAINPLGKVPCIVDGRYRLAESHAIMEYLACTRAGVADHWYPSDAQKRSKIQSILDWHHSNLRRGSVTLLLTRVGAPMLGGKEDPRAAAEGLSILKQSLEVMETVWLQEGYPFLAGCRQPSIADLSLICEIMQLQVFQWQDCILTLHRKPIRSLNLYRPLIIERGNPFPPSRIEDQRTLKFLDEADVAALLGPYTGVTAWIAAVKRATGPHFDEVHKMVYRSISRTNQKRTNQNLDDSSVGNSKKTVTVVSKL